VTSAIARYEDSQRLNPRPMLPLQKRTDLRSCPVRLGHGPSTQYRDAPLSRYAMAEAASNDRAAFVAEMSEMLGPYSEGAVLRFPMESHVLEARR